MSAVNTYSQLHGRPDVPAERVAAILDARYGISGSLRSLPSERDQNFLVSTSDGPKYVAKIANRDELRSTLDLQARAMRRLHGAGVGCPEVVPADDGSDVLELAGHLVRVLTFLPGSMLADRTDRPPALLHEVGAFLAQMVKGLVGFADPAAERHLQWDVRHTADVIGEYLPDVQPDRRAVVDSTRLLFVERVAPRMPDLGYSVIHGDANDHNLVLDGDRVAGVIDFGDMVHSLTVNELAVGCAYALLGQPEPDVALSHVVAGYESVLALTETERDVLPDLVQIRLATSVAISAHQRTLAPDHEYLSVSEAHAWDALTRLRRR